MYFNRLPLLLKEHSQEVDNQGETEGVGEGPGAGESKLGRDEVEPSGEGGELMTERWSPGVGKETY